MALYDKRRGNGEAKVDERFRRRLVQLLQRTPEHFGWKRPTWTREARWWLPQANVECRSDTHRSVKKLRIPRTCDAHTFASELAEGRDDTARTFDATGLPNREARNRGDEREVRADRRFGGRWRGGQVDAPFHADRKGVASHPDFGEETCRKTRRRERPADDAGAKIRAHEATFDLRDRREGGRWRRAGRRRGRGGRGRSRRRFGTCQRA